jgi:hypothetical protein
MNPEAESANNEGSNAINRQKPPLITNNEPRGRILPTTKGNAIIQAETAINN